MGALSALIPLAIQFAPQLIGLLAGPAAGTALGHVADAAQTVFGTTDPDAIKLKIQQDASSADKFKAEIEARTAELHEQMADLQSARSQTLGLVQAGSVIAWGAPIVSILVVVGFFAVLTLLLWRPLNLNDVTTQILLILLGTLASAFTQVINYWLGSSSSSKGKDGTIAQMATASTATASSALAQTAGAVKKMFR